MIRRETNITKCITCGDDLHPERARKYNYCMKPECQAKNLKGLTMVAVGVNKSAEQYMLLDEDTKAELAQGKYHDQRRGTFGQPGQAPGPAKAAPAPPPQPAQGKPAPVTADSARPGSARPGSAKTGSAKTGPARPVAVAPSPPRLPGTASQRRLAVLYNQQGLRPDDIARKLGLSRYEVTQIILASRGRGRA